MTAIRNQWASKKDRELRPWTIDDDFDEKIEGERDILVETIGMTSHSRAAGFRGYSLLDGKPKEFYELKASIALAAEEEEANRTALLELQQQQLQHQVPNDSAQQESDDGQDPAEEGDPNSCGEPADDEVVRLGSSEALSDVPGEDEGMADIIADMAATIENLTSLERRALSSSQQRSRQNKRTADSCVVKSVSYVGRTGPAVMNISARKFQQFLKRMDPSSSSSLSSSSLIQCPPTAQVHTSPYSSSS